jgi:lipopolysaccharide biosynthesis glycosyltransferase
LYYVRAVDSTMLKSILEEEKESKLKIHALNRATSKNNASSFGEFAVLACIVTVVVVVVVRRRRSEWRDDFIAMHHFLRLSLSVFV